MLTIFDNIETKFLENEAGNGLRDVLGLAFRGDFCVGYFNLRGWRAIDAVVKMWPASHEESAARLCRLLVGMHRLSDDDQRELFSNGGDPERLDQCTVVRLKQTMAAEFRRQLTLGVPTDADEAGLRRLARQLLDGRLQVKLFLAHILATFPLVDASVKAATPTTFRDLQRASLKT